MSQLDLQDLHNQLQKNHDIDTDSMISSTLEEFLEEEDDDDSLNFSTELTRESFQLNSFNHPTSFLLKHYKFWSLDDLISSLSNLLSDIDNELIELVNFNYLNFIKLGNSIDGSFDLIHNLKVDLMRYISSLNKLNDNKINQDLTRVEMLINYKLKLLNYKKLIKLIISLNQQVENFTRSCDLKNGGGLNELKELLSIYLNILKNYQFLLTKFKELDYTKYEILIGLVKKFNYLKLEFKSILNEYLKDHKDTLSTNEKFELLKMNSIL